MRSTSLQHTEARRFGLHGSSLPATFRPQGLIALSTAYSLRTRARHTSGEQRSWDLPFGGSLSRKVTQPLGRIDPTRRYRHSEPRSKPRGALGQPTSGL